MVTSITWFAGVRSTQGRRLALKDSDLNRFIEKPRTYDGDKLDLPLWSPATFKGNKRSLANVENVSMLVIDIDSLHVETNAFVACLAACLPCTGWWIHTSYSSKPGALRFRAFSKYERVVTGDEHRGIMAITTHLLDKGGIPIDGACKDASRGYFAPARGTNKPYEYRIIRGTAFPVSQALAAHAKRTEAAENALRAGRYRPFVESTRGDERRALAYLEGVPGAYAGQRGHDHTFNIALKLVKGFGLTSDAAFALLSQWNRRCNPPWSAGQLKRKIQQAESGRLPNNFMQKTGSK
jgi:hypothetical protein